MSSNLQALDEFPTFTGEESPQEQIRQLQNYLYIVAEQLKYSLRNIGVENLNPNQWNAMKEETLKGLTVEKLTAKAETFIEPGYEEWKTIHDHVMKVALIPDDRIALYDFNGDGEVTITDMLRCKSMMLGKSSLAEWAGAVKTEVSVTIDVTDPNKAILISGTNMWGRTIEHWYGLDGCNNGKFHGHVTVAGSLMVGNDKLEFGEDENGKPVIGIGGEFKLVSWKDNGDGTCTLIGQ